MRIKLQLPLVSISAFCCCVFGQRTLPCVVCLKTSIKMCVCERKCEMGQQMDIAPWLLAKNLYDSLMDSDLTT